MAYSVRKLLQLTMCALDIGAELEGIVPDVWKYTIQTYGHEFGLSPYEDPAKAITIATEAIIGGIEQELGEIWLKRESDKNDKA